MSRRSSTNTPWYRGPALLDYLETIDVESETTQKPFRFPVQWVNRPNADFRGYAGTVMSGTIKVGDPIVVRRIRADLPGQGIVGIRRSAPIGTIRRCHHHDADRRSRRCAWRPSGQCRVAPGGFRSIRGTLDLDERRAAHAGTLISGPDRTKDDAAHRNRHQIQDRCQYAASISPPAHLH